MLIKCPACEHDVSDKAIRCNKCGEPINNTTVATPQGKSSATLSYIIMAIAFIIGIVVFISEIHHFSAFFY